MSSAETRPDEVLNFWANAGSKKWWAKDPDFDSQIRQTFETTHELAKNGELNNWLTTPDDTLALVIVLDQFSRNLFRNNPRAFAQDEQCVEIVHNAIKSGFDHNLRTDISMFIYMPLMHSEIISDQELCLTKMGLLEPKIDTKHAKIHLDIIKRFGRFPHRNGVLGRTTTPEEQAFLSDGGFSG